MILSKLSAEICRGILDKSDLSPVTPKTITDVEEIVEEVGKVRGNGFSICFEETILGEFNVAVPLLTPDQEVLGAIVVSAPVQDYTTEKILSEIVPSLQKAARSVVLPVAASET